MPYRKEEFINGEIYHVMMRALDNNLIFKNDDDYYRGIFSIYEFNNTISTEIWLRRKKRKKEKELEKALGGPSSQHSQQMKRDKMVDVLAFCLMPNHIHLLLKQLTDNGITKFMAKVGTGYAGYFNRKYNRKGYVFQNRFSSVHIKDDNQLKIVFTYIHTNPVSLIEPNWKELGVKDSEKAIKFIEEYKWSSYPDYINKKNFPSVTERTFISGIMGGEQGIRDAIKNWIMHKKELSEFDNLFLE